MTVPAQSIWLKPAAGQKCTPRITSCNLSYKG